jgi:hypothetical protein
MIYYTKVTKKGKRCERMKNISKYINCIATVMLLMFVFTNTCFALWWGTPGYEWAISNKLISVKTSAQLDTVVLHTDFYSIMLKYLTMKNIAFKNSVTQYEYYDNINNVAKSLFEMINVYTSKNELTAEEYRQVASLIDHGMKILEDQKAFLKRDNVKNLNEYLVCVKYKAATLIKDYSYRKYVLNSITQPPNAEVFDYAISPFAGNITRREFLILMYNLISDNQASEDEIIQQFIDGGVLIGYRNDYMLDKDMTYTEMLTFLHRFEVFDFNPVPEEENVEGEEVQE